MSRKPRVEYQGAIFHVIQRGNNKETIFPKDREKGFFLDELKSLKKVYNYHLLGYVLLSNHYHLIIQTLDEPLQKIMHRLNSTFARYYNFFQEHSGHVFQGRYKAILVLDERYLFALLRYIHQNPVRAGICDSVDQYPWSSDECYRQNKEGFVDIQIILDMLNDRREKALRKYSLFMAHKELDLAKEFEEAQIIGETVHRTVVEYNKVEDGLSSLKLKSLDDILKETGPSPEEFQLIKDGSRLRKLTSYKKEYVRQARNERYTLEEIGNNISLSQGAIFKLVNK
ncbi:MAG: transposase [Bacillota bacterium]|nr:transposase [Bacillota bacterium]